MVAWRSKGRVHPLFRTQVALSPLDPGLRRDDAW